MPTARRSWRSAWAPFVRRSWRCGTPSASMWSGGCMEWLRWLGGNGQLALATGPACRKHTVEQQQMPRLLSTALPLVRHTPILSTTNPPATPASLQAHPRPAAGAHGPAGAAAPLPGAHCFRASFQAPWMLCPLCGGTQLLSPPAPSCDPALLAGPLLQLECPLFCLPCRSACRLRRVSGCCPSQWMMCGASSCPGAQPPSCHLHSWQQRPRPQPQQP